MSLGAKIAIGVGAALVLVVAFVGITGYLGMRSYVKASKVVEARNALAMIARDATAAYENGGDPLVEPAVRKLCPSASKPVPADRKAISGRKYQSTPSEWQADKDRNAGFACLRFEMMAPQQYQYEYVATETSFTARAWGDLDGDGVYSTFEIRGEVVGDSLRVAPTITETMPDE